MSENCSKLRENIAREKADINWRNIEKYEASERSTAKGQEDTYRAQQGRTDNGGQSKQIAKQVTSPGGSHTHPGGMGGTGGGGNLLRNQMGIRICPQIKLIMKKKNRKRRIQIVQ